MHEWVHLLGKWLSGYWRTVFGVPLKVLCHVLSFFVVVALQVHLEFSSNLELWITDLDSIADGQDWMSGSWRIKSGPVWFCLFALICRQWAQTGLQGQLSSCEFRCISFFMSCLAQVVGNVFWSIGQYLRVIESMLRFAVGYDQVVEAGTLFVFSGKAARIYRLNAIACVCWLFLHMNSCAEFAMQLTDQYRYCCTELVGMNGWSSM